MTAEGNKDILAASFEKPEKKTQMGLSANIRGEGACMCAKAFQSCPTLCYPMDCIPPGSFCPCNFSRQEYWSRLPFPPPGDLPDPGIEPMSLASPALAGRFFTNCATWEALFYILKDAYSLEGKL